MSIQKPSNAEAVGRWMDSQPVARTREDLIREYSRRALQGALRDGRIVRTLPNVYLGAAQSTSFEGRCSAALVWAGPQASLGGTTAAHLHGILEQVPHTVTLVTHRAARLRGPDWITALQPNVGMRPLVTRGLRVVPLADALIQSWRQLPVAHARGLVLDAIRDRAVSALDLERRALDYPRINSRREFLRLVADLRDGAESYLEHFAQTRVFNTRDFSGFTRQVPIHAASQRYVIDMFHAEAQVAVELDGRRYHSDDLARRRDLARDADLAARGIITIRLTFEDVMERPQWCRTRVRSALSAQRKLRSA